MRKTKTNDTAQIILLDDSVIKHQDKNRTVLEVARSQIGREIGRQSGTFLVPKVLTCDLEQGSITFERVFFMKTLRNVLSTSLSPEELIQKAAIALATIHNFPFASLREQAFPLKEYSSEIPSGAFIHGDFSITNVLCRGEEHALVIVDWGPAWWGHTNPDQQNIYQDLSIFILSLFLRRPLEQCKIANPSLLAKAFLEIYGGHVQVEFCVDYLRTYFPILLERFIRYPRNFREKLQLFSNYQSVCMAQNFIEGLTANRVNSP